MQYSVCAPAVFSGRPVHAALAQIREAGADAYEFWGWWDQDMAAIEEAQRENQLKCAALCTRMIPLNVPRQRAAYLQGLAQSIAVAKRLDCSVLISQIGQEQADASRAEQHACIVDGLRACVPQLLDAGVTLVIEPLNTLVDHKGYYLSGSAEAFDIVREVGSPQVKVLYDVYHQQITEGNLIANLTANVDAIGHIHVAGNPGRHEPYENSEVHYPSVIGALQAAGYAGCIGLEYFPLRDPVESLKGLFAAMPIGR